MARKGQRSGKVRCKPVPSRSVVRVDTTTEATDSPVSPECMADVQRVCQLTKTLRVVCKRVDSSMTGWDIKPKRNESTSDKVSSTSQEGQSLLNKDLTATDEATKVESLCYQTPQQKPSTSTWQDESICETVIDADITAVDHSFQLDVLNLGYKLNSDEPSSCSTPKDNNSLKGAAEKKPSIQKVFRVTAPLYICVDNTNNRIDNTIANKKGRAKKRRSAKRRLCEEAIGVPEAKCAKEATIPKSLPDILCNAATLMACPVEDQRQSRDSSCLALSPGLQIDTAHCLPGGTVKKAYNRITAVCLTDISYTPQYPITRVPGAIAGRLTYDNSGRLSVMETKETMLPGIYRVVATGATQPHPCLKRFVALEALLSPCASVSGLSSHSQYFVLNEMHAIPRERWRQRLSIMVVTLRLEDYLHTANFHQFALPLLLWYGEQDIWTSWTKEPAVKIVNTTSKRKNCTAHVRHGQTKRRKTKASTTLRPAQQKISCPNEEKNTIETSEETKQPVTKPKFSFRIRPSKPSIVQACNSYGETCVNRKMEKNKSEKIVPKTTSANTLFTKVFIVQESRPHVMARCDKLSPNISSKTKPAVRQSDTRCTDGKRTK